MHVLIEGGVFLQKNVFTFTFPVPFWAAGINYPAANTEDKVLGFYTHSHMHTPPASKTNILKPHYNTMTLAQGIFGSRLNLEGSDAWLKFHNSKAKLY